MKSLIIPAISALLLAGLPAHAHATDWQPVQSARNDSGGNQNQGDANRSDKGNKGDKGEKGNAGTSGGDQSGRFSHGNNDNQNKFGTGGSQNSGATTTGGTGKRFDHKASGSQNTSGYSGGQSSGATTSGTNSRFDRTRSSDHKVFGGTQNTGTTFGKRPSNWNKYPRQFDMNTYQRNFTSPRHYHWQSYNRPSGWYYRRWSYGEIFPSIFWGRDYWLTDYWMFDLPIPPYGYVWVRYGDDALLINRRTGRVLEVVYGVFD